MKINKYILILWAVLGCLISTAQESPRPKKGPMTFEKFFKDGMKKIDGTIPVYTDGTKYYVEFSDQVIGKNLMATGAIVNGNWFGTPSVSTSIFMVNKGVNNKLYVTQKINQDVIDDKNADAGMVKAVKSSSLQPIQAVVNIEAYSKNGKGYIVDITKDLNSNGVFFSFPNLASVNAPEANGSGIDTVKSTTDGVKFICYRSQKASAQILFFSIEFNATSYVEWGLQLLPDDCFNARTRLSDKRVGFGTYSYNNYMDNGVKKVSVARRWIFDIKPEDVEKYKKGELVEPVKPIVFYLHPTVPKSDIPIIQRSVNEWNSCFESAGFKNALVIKIGEPEIVLAPRSVLVACIPGGSSPSASIMYNGQGNQLSAMIRYGTHLASIQAKENLVMFDAIKPRMKNPESEVEARAEHVRWQFSVAIGTILGLEPNFAGSCAYTPDQLRDASWLKKNGTSASIMDDCPVNYLVQPEDKQVDLADLYPKVSHYDRWAIEWAYRVFPDNKDEQADQTSLQSHLAKQKTNPYLTYVPRNTKDSRVGINDISSDRIKAAELTLNNIKRVYPKLESISDAFSTDKDTYEDYLMDLESLSGVYYRSMSPVTCELGGYQIQPLIKDVNNGATTYTTKERQKEIMNFLEKNAFCATPAWKYNATLVKIDGRPGTDFGVGLANNSISAFTDPAVLNSLIKAEQKLGDKAFTLSDLHKDIKRMLFLDFNPTKSLDKLQRKSQFSYIMKLSALVKNLETDKKIDDLSVNVLANYRDLYHRIKTLSTTHQDSMMKAHYKSLVIYMTRELNNKVSTKGNDALASK